MDAWCDESMRSSSDTSFYLLGATYVSGEESDVDMRALESIKPKGALKLHWRDMGDKMKIASINAISPMPFEHLIVVGRNMNGVKQERVRRKTLETLAFSVQQQGITRMVLESRGKKSDKSDIALLLAQRNRGLEEDFDFTHQRGAENKMLWVPDQVLGAYGDFKCAVDMGKYGNAWETLYEKIRIVEIDV